MHTLYSAYIQSSHLVSLTPQSQAQRNSWPMLFPTPHIDLLLFLARAVTVFDGLLVFNARSRFYL
jgi:hypothetical protein